MDPTPFFSLQNKQSKKDFENKVKIAKENAEKGKFASKIQRRMKAENLKREQRTKDRNSVFKMLKDLAKILAVEKVKAIFFLNPDKLYPILAQISNIINRQDLKKHRLSLEDLHQALSTLLTVLSCGWNFYNPKVIVANPVYNLISGSKKAIYVMDVFVLGLKRLAKVLLESQFRRESKCGSVLEVVARILCQLLQPIEAEKVADSKDLLNDLSKFRNFQNKCVELLSTDLLRYLPRDQVLPVTSPQISLAQAVTSRKLLQPIALEGDSIAKTIREALNSQQDIDSLLFLIKTNKIPVTCPRVLEAILFTVSPRGENRPPLALTMGSVLADIILTIIMQRASELSPTSLLGEEMSVKEETKLKSASSVVSSFLYNLSLQKSNEDLQTTIYTAFKLNEDFFRALINLVYKIVQATVVCNQQSTSLNQPSAEEMHWFTILLSALKYKMLVSTAEEFLQGGPSLEKILQILFYLQNYVTYFFMVGQTDAKIDCLAQLSSDVIKGFYQYNSVKQFFEPNRLKMCKLNTFLHENLMSELKSLENNSLELLHKVLCLFPGSFPFAERLKLMEYLYPAPPSTAVFAKIRRGPQFINDALRLVQATALEKRGAAKVRVKFVDEFGTEELGHDDGGLWKEFLLIALEKIFDPQYGLFWPTKGDELVVNPQAKQYVDVECTSMFYLSGWLLARAIRDKILLRTQFSPLFLRNLAGYRNGLNQLARFDEDYYSQMCKLKGMTGIDSLELTFSVQEEMGQEVDLVPGGKDKQVTDSNKIEYIFRRVDHKVQKQFEQGMIAVNAGFNSVIPRDLLKMFNEEELSRIINGGLGNIDIGNLRSHTVYRAGYAAKDSYIKDFWNIVGEMSEEQKRQLLRFVTCNERPPILGFAALSPPFTIQKPDTSSDERLPEAATCFNTLRLPRYSKPSILKEKLLYAIKFNKGFHNL